MIKSISNNQTKFKNKTEFNFMKIVGFSVKNYQFTIVVFLLVLALGLNSLFNMPRGEDPPFDAPNFIVVAVYPGTSPNDMEELVADKIEDKINELDGIKRIRTTISDGLCIANIEFNWGSPIDEKYNEVVREINALRPQLPQDLYSLEIQKITSADINSYQIGLTSESAEYSELNKQAEKLKDMLESIRTIKKVNILGNPERQVQVELDLAKMSILKIPVNRVFGAIQSENVNIPGGSIDVGTKKFNVKTSGDYASIDEIKNTIVSGIGEKIVYLKDIATINLDYETQNYITRYNGKKSIFVTISEKMRTNIIQNQEMIKPILEEFKKQLPANIQLNEGFVQAEDVSHRLDGFSRDFAIAIFLVLLTLLPLGTRASIVVMISIPLSLSMGLAILHLMGYTINQLSIVGMVVALGLLVDDSIVVVENIERFLRDGYSKNVAAIDATKQIALAVLGCTATLIFAFLPLTFLPEGAGEFIRSLPMAVIATVLSSLFVSITIVPFLSSLILTNHSNPEGNFALRMLKKAIGGSYRQLLNVSLAHPVYTLLVALLIFVGSLMLIPKVGFSLFPKSEKPMFMVNIEAPLGTNLNETDKVARYVESEIKKHKDVKSVFTNVGKGNPRIYYNIAGKSESPNEAQLFVRLNEMNIKELDALVDQFRLKFSRYPNAKIEVKSFEQGPPIEAPVAIRIFGNNLDSLRNISTRLETIIKNTEGTIYVNNPLQIQNTEMQLKINKEKAGMLGIPTAEIDRTVRLGIAGLKSGNFKDENGDDHDILVTLNSDEKNKTLETFNKMYISSLTGSLVPLKQVASLEFSSSVPTIRHYNKNRFVVITSYVKTGYNTKKVTDEIISKLGQLNLPKDYSYVIAGEVESSKESFGGIGTIIIITAFGFMGILLLEFKTFKSSLIVLSVIPLGIIGAVLTLLIVGKTFSFVAIVGLIALIGIEVKNSILLVDYTNYLREQGMELNQAIQEAGETRFVPIILTTATAIGGLIPLVLEDAPLYAPLAWVLIGGLISSTLLTRLVTPVLYKLLAPNVEVINKENNNLDFSTSLN